MTLVAGDVLARPDRLVEEWLVVEEEEAASPRTLLLVVGLEPPSLGRSATKECCCCSSTSPLELPKDDEDVDGPDDDMAAPAA